MSGRGRVIAGFALLAAGAVLAGIGIAAGDVMQVFGKAVVICLECIGVG